MAMQFKLTQMYQFLQEMLLLAIFVNLAEQWKVISSFPTSELVSSSPSISSRLWRLEASSREVRVPDFTSFRKLRMSSLVDVAEHRLRRSSWSLCCFLSTSKAKKWKEILDTNNTTQYYIYTVYTSSVWWKWIIFIWLE